MEHGSAGLRITPDDYRYPTLKRGFNPRWTAEPHYVQLVHTPDEVVEALRTALAEEPATSDKKRITVRSGGHCYENFVCSDDVRVIIDVGLMNGVYYDSGMDAVCVEAGASNWDIGEKIGKKLGKVLPGGSCNTVGAGGHIIGGGFGLFSRQHGLTVDYLHAVEVAVVTEQGEVELVTAKHDSEDEDLKDLWWAHTGGGGGNFGVATRFWFRGLPHAPPGAYRVEAGWKWKDLLDNGYTDFHRIVTNFGDFFHNHQGKEGDRYADLFGILQLTPSTHDKVGLLAQIDASIPEAKERLREFVDMIDETVATTLTDRPEAHGEHPVLTGSKEPVHVEWDKLQQVGPLVNDESGKYKSAYLRKPLPDSQIQAMWNALTHPPDGISHAVMQIDAYGSKVNTVSNTETAMAQRDSVMKMQHQVYWKDGVDGTKPLEWIRNLYRTMYGWDTGVPVPNEVTDGCYINYPDVDVNDDKWNPSKTRWSELYYKHNYPRLQRAKKRWDPKNVFHHELSVELPKDSA
ncbi:FAD/FMN-containing dehydrogenase [Haloactinospora alba]|uniref:FAD/FMN-containing dehydrogenase n=1 Tax=Haloactinospora alba TaxID=405555 RepID=A0A543NN12_9ACTN|nr:BBE domain-containing protein [Haloactinospora alba]TQN33218.1 FAD/FMN-containing dehydrogenase [Haloactinospora alba]